MKSIAVVYFSGYGHTVRQAQAVVKGLEQQVNTRVQLLAISEGGALTESEWECLDVADAIVFGAPTYMGTVPWQFKKFADDSSKRWFASAWKNKLGAGFTNSASMNGDKATTISWLMTFAMQHRMLWAGAASAPSNSKSADRNDLNYLGSYSGLMAQSPSDANPDEGPLPGDLETAKAFGLRIAQLTQGLSI
ncbi:flavodoxin family protein [Agaribacterium sp. ZY112]|uniref:flavodoxin family protein n=1 Tax=Agaribacterium sp. ZY112 TaxID=3233574 RepID=UPI0035267FD0